MAILCGAVGLAGSAFAQAGAGAGSPAATGSAGSEIGPGDSNANAAGTTHTGPGQIDSPAGANANTSSSGASANATASASNAPQGDKPDFLGNVQSKSTPARGLKGAAMKRVDTNERRITAELNRASAAGTGNANASNQASISTGSNQNIQ
jgi:hypothetical protein